MQLDALGRCAVVGGSGYLGRHLVAALADAGRPVRSIDLAPTPVTGPLVDAQTVDVTDAVAIGRALRDVDTVFHLAALVETRTLVSRDRRHLVHRVNVDGTAHVLAGARAGGAARLVFTGSNNLALDSRHRRVVLDDDPADPTRHRDVYSQTKAEAERLVIGADDPGGLRTVSVRMGGIYGPGDPVFAGTVVDTVDRGLLKAGIGPGTAQCENTYIDNAVHGHLCAALALANGAPGVAGRWFHVHDGPHVSALESPRPWVEAMGVRWPSLRLPAALASSAALASELVHLLGGPKPVLTRLEVWKVTVHHPTSAAPARDHLGYEPVVPYDEATRRTAAWCADELARRRAARPLVDRPAAGWFAVIPTGLAMTWAIAWLPPAFGVFARRSGPLGRLPRATWQVVWAIATLEHVRKAVVAWRLSTAHGVARRGGWTAQTFLLGFPSLGLLRRRVEQSQHQLDGAAGLGRGLPVDHVPAEREIDRAVKGGPEHGHR